MVVSVVSRWESARKRKGEKEENRGEHSGREERGEACRTLADVARWSKLSTTNTKGEWFQGLPEARAVRFEPNATVLIWQCDRVCYFSD